MSAQNAPGPRSRPAGRIRPVRLLAVAALVVLVVAMALNTRFLTPEEVAALAPKPFDPAATAAGLYDQAKQELPGRAADLGEVITASQADLAEAAASFEAVSPSEGVYVFAVSTTATVAVAGEDSIELAVDGAPSETPVIVPLGTAVNGTVIRDAMGFTFADAPGQSDYQYVGDELKKLVLADVATAVEDPAGLQGRQVEVLGAVSLQATGAALPPAKPVNVQPVVIEVVR